ncbi:MAG: thioredoxin-dependent thiol peroxidase [Cytophagaceae bacterium]|nr:thioredoxin-dependent thiol peroxidase [Cytophagaceae bacterium]MBL0303846.1 thioredoxin-dependent thiol peroxidase [Cytophagaceae bacterium]MBL0326663.1 thioredoxin-dependent thiol peroxidase [Cytophagaceae bacterium]
MRPEINSQAPDFEALNQDGKAVKLSDFRGKKVVLYFYPKDNTPTCTTQACNLRDNYEQLLKNGYVVLGVSVDNVKSHAKFKAKFELPFDLIADPDHAIVDKYGVWGEKMMYGKKYMGTFRTTFVIDEKGIITEIIDKVESKAHTSQIIA